MIYFTSPLPPRAPFARTFSYFVYVFVFVCRKRLQNLHSFLLPAAMDACPELFCPEGEKDVVATVTPMTPPPFGSLGSTQPTPGGKGGVSVLVAAAEAVALTGEEAHEAHGGFSVSVSSKMCCVRHQEASTLLCMLHVHLRCVTPPLPTLLM